jgi:hypothetical protein
MNTFGQNVIQEIPVDENIHIILSEYKLSEQAEDKKGGTPEKETSPKYESIKLSLIVELQNSSLVTVQLQLRLV